MTNKNRITSEEMLLAIKKARTSSHAKAILQFLPEGTTTRAFATAARKLVHQGQVSISYKKGIGYYRFLRMRPVKTVVMKNFSPKEIGHQP